MTRPGDRLAQRLVPDIVNRTNLGPAAHAGGTDGVALPPATRMIFPPWLYEIESAQDYTIQATGALPGGAGQTFSDQTAAGVLQLLGTYVGVLSFITIFVDAPTTALDVKWTLRFNGAPVQGFDNLRSFPRIAQNLSITFPGPKRIPIGARVDVIATNNNASAWTVGYSVGGWFWLQDDGARIFGTGY